MQVRELVTKLGFDVDEEALKRYNDALANTQKRVSVMAGAWRLLGAYVGYQGANAFLRLSSNLEVGAASFETMLKSGEKAKTFLADLYQFAKDTPFGFFQLQELSKRMMAYGIEAEKVIPTLTRLGDAAGALGLGDEGIMRMVLALGQLQAKGKAESQEMRQFAEAGIPAFRYVADALNTDVAGAMKLVEQRAVSAEVAVNAIMSGIDRDFGGGMARRMETLAGQWDRLKQNMEGFFGAMGGESFRSPVTSLVRSINEWLDRNEEAVLRLGRTLGSMLGAGVRLFGALASAIAKVVNALGGVERVSVMVGVAIAAIGGSIVLGKITGLIKALRLLEIQQWRLWLSNPYLLIAAAVVALALLIEDFYGWLNGKDSILGDALGTPEEFKKKLDDALEAVKGLFPTFWNTFWAAMVTQFEKVVPGWMQSLLRGVGTLIAPTNQSGQPNMALAGMYGPNFSPSTFSPPPASAAAGVRQENHFDITVPPGTPAAQVDYLQAAAKNIFSADKLKILANNPLSEK